MFSRIGFCFLLAAALPGQSPAPPRVGVGVIQRKLTLADAIGQALANNLEIEIEKSNTAAASAAARGARGFYDPTFRWLPSVESRNTPTGSVLQGAGGKLAEHFHSEDFSFRQRLPWQGSVLGLDFENNRQTSSSPFLTLNPLITSRLVASFTQPLLRNRAIDRERGELHIRRQQMDVSETQFELRTIDVVTRVEQAYWDLVAARQNAQVASDTVEWARQQLARNRRMIDAGSLAPVELSASEAELERRLDTWYAAVGAITETENALKTLLSGGRQEPIWNDEIVPVEEAPLAPPAGDDLREAVARAIHERPELKLVSYEQQINEMQKQQNADQIKPQLNLVASYANTGLAGALRTGDNPFTASNALLVDRVNRLSAQSGLSPLVAPSLGTLPPLLIGGYGTSLSNLFGGRFQSFQAGLSLDFNFRNTTAEANLAQSAIAERRLKLEQAQVEQAIQAQVRNALQAIETAHQRITAAEASAHAASEKLDSETRLFQTGESTNFLVLTRQNEYTDSRHRLLVAKLDFNKAVARLEQALGITLASHRIKLH